MRILWSGWLLVLLALGCGVVQTVANPAGSKPNIILIMVDDAGFADFGFTGGLVDTPVLDQLAREGMLFTKAHSNARCMPTRASLMSGLYPQLAGENQLNGKCVTIPELLKEVGYATYMIGKWHLGYGKGVPGTREIVVDGLQSTPIGRGFDRFYGLWHGAGFVTKAKLMAAAQDGKGPWVISDNEPVPWEQVPDDYYNTTTWTDKAIEFIQSTPPEKPFFLYASHTAPHWPLDPPAESRARYKGRFAEGWDVVRAKVFENQKRLGIIPADYPYPPREAMVEAWSASHPFNAKYQDGCEMYYASITEVDTQVGRLLETLKSMGRLDNTLIVFLSDNGADTVIGGNPRGHVSNTPFMAGKLSYYEGGVITPLFVWWKGKVAAGTINHRQQVMLEDHMATFLEVAGATYPTEFKGRKIHPASGRSYLKAITDISHADPDRVWCWEHDGQRGVVAGEWKAIMMDSRHPVPKKDFPPDRDGWHLYKLAPNNRVETEDLAKKNPEKMKEMIDIWNSWAKSVHWSPSSRWNLHPTDAANGIQVYGEKKSKSAPAD